MTAALVGTLVVLAAAAAVLRRRDAAWVGTAALVAGLMSLTSTGWSAARGGLADSHAPGAVLVTCELPALLLVVFLAARRGPTTVSVGGAATAGAAVALSLLRFGRPSGLTLVGGCVWALVAMGAAMAGMYLRSLEAGRQQEVAGAATEQRLALAADLHDFVAHDVSEILALSQAGGILAAQAPTLRDTFDAITGAALRALAALDRTVQGATSARPTAADYTELLTRFASAVSAEVEVAVDPAVLEDTSPDTGLLLFRVLSEGLTNVLRHAPTLQRLEVRLDRTNVEGQPSARLTLANDGVAPRSSARQGGSGIAGLRERAESVGGMLTAEPHGGSRWALTAVVPLQGEA